MQPTYIVLLILAVVVVAAIAFFITRKGAPTPLEAPRETPPLPEKRAPRTPPEDKREKASEKKAPPKEAKEEATRKPAEEPAPLAKPASEQRSEPQADAATSVAPAPREPAVEALKLTPTPTQAKAERPAAPARKRDVEGLRRGLAKVREREGFFGRLVALFSDRREIDPQLLEQMEEVLLTSDVGVKTTSALLDGVKQKLAKNDAGDGDRVWNALRQEATAILEASGTGGINLSARPTVVMFVGVNGVGKTTTIGKLATKLKAEGKTVVLAAGDTFRAAAVQQLKVWGKRVDVEVVAGKDGAAPGGVIFDAIQRAKDLQADVVLVDTAGRLHTKSNLMDELTKISRTMGKALDGAPHETLLVLDATNGQNAMQQAALFKESLPLTGIVLTKLDGTAKGGVILGISAEHRVPVRYVGIGERAEDLRDFVPEEFVEAMLGQTETADV